MILFSYKFVFATTINFRYQENGGNPSCTFIIDGYTFFTDSSDIKRTNLKNGLGDFILFKKELEYAVRYDLVLVDDNLSSRLSDGVLRFSGSPSLSLVKQFNGGSTVSFWDGATISGKNKDNVIISTNLDVGELMGYVPNYRDWRVQYLGEAMTPLLENLFIRMRAQVVEIVRTIAFLALLLVLSITLLRKFLLFLKNFGSSL